MKEKITEIREIILDFLFPPVCLICRKRLLSIEPQPSLSEKISSSPDGLGLAEGEPSERRKICLPAGRRAVSSEARRTSDESQRTDTLGERAVAKGNSFPFLCPSCSQKIKMNTAAFCPVCSRRLPENKKTCHQDSPFVLAAAGFYGDEILDSLLLC